jgi:predicted PurR-regulated permease PerM
MSTRVPATTSDAHEDRLTPAVLYRAVLLTFALVVVVLLFRRSTSGRIGLIVAVPVLVTLKVLVEELWVRPHEASDARAELRRPAA